MPQVSTHVPPPLLSLSLILTEVFPSATGALAVDSIKNMLGEMPPTMFQVGIKLYWRETSHLTNLQ